MSEQSKAYPVLSYDQLQNLIRELSLIFDIVRTVDPALQRAVIYDADGRHVNLTEHCFDAWNKCGRCENCVSAMAYRQKKRLTKLEFIGQDIFRVTTQYMEVDGKPCLLEIVEKDEDYILCGAVGKNRLIDEIQRHTRAIYTDEETKACNRSYYEDQLATLEMEGAAMVAIAPMPLLKFGPACRHEVVREVARLLRQNMQQDDSLIRWDENRFLVVFADMKPERLREKMQVISDLTEKIAFPSYKKLKVSVQIGGVAHKAPVSALQKMAEMALSQCQSQCKRIFLQEM